MRGVQTAMASNADALTTEKRHLPTAVGKDRDSIPHKRARKMSKPEKEHVSGGRFQHMFEDYRDELEEHYDRRERISRASRDVTALSKKIIFALHRIQDPISPFPLPDQKNIDSYIDQISSLLTPLSQDLTPLNRHRYASSLRCLEELAEALSFSHYLQHQTLISQAEMQELVPGGVQLLWGDYMNGLFDLFGEMMRFATVNSATRGSLQLVAQLDEVEEEQQQQGGHGQRRSILQDMQELGCAFEMLPEIPTKEFRSKRDVMRQSVIKVEKLGYGLAVRGKERPKGWVPEEKDDVPAPASPG